MDYFEAVQLTAFSLIAKTRRKEPVGDQEYVYRQIFRWYSKTFNTALHEVLDLPVHDVLVAYWECHFESMDDEELEEERLEFVKTEADRELERKIKAMDDLDIFYTNKEQEKTQPAAIDKLAGEVDNFRDALNKYKQAHKEGKEASMEGTVKTSLPPNIKMEFANEEDIDWEEDSLGMLDKPKGG